MEEQAIEYTLIPIDYLYENDGQIQGLPSNPRTISTKQFNKLVKSIKAHPQMLYHRQLIVSKVNGSKFIVIGGNQRLRALKHLGYTEVPCSILHPSTTIEDMKAILIKDNAGFGDWDWDMLANEWDSDDLNEWGVNVWQDGEEEEKPKEEKPQEEEETLEGEEEEEVKSVIPILDVLFPSDNDYEIPVLKSDMQAGRVELPITPWGANSRLRKDVTTYHFYVDDYRFEALWKDPSTLINSGVKAIVEPNCSCHDQTPVAYGLQLIYKKRWLARYCQEYGIKVYADLNTAPKFYEWNKLGIPKGYNAFFTRGLIGWDEHILSCLKIAQEISGLEKPNLIVYGGGKTIEKLCQEHGILYLTDFINSK